MYARSVRILGIQGVRRAIATTRFGSTLRHTDTSSFPRKVLCKDDGWTPLKSLTPSPKDFDILERVPPLDDVSSSTIYIAMSSGVDSSTAAAMLAKQYPGRVKGIYMCNWVSSAKCVETEWNEVQKVCQHLEIPALRVNFEKDYWNDVFEPMLKYYMQGLTPNPDVSCNRYIKFGSLVDHLNQIDQSDWWLATGHYARVAEITRRQNTKDQAQGYKEHSFALMRPKDKGKDQSYYLSTVDQKVLRRVFFPLWKYNKKEVRRLAETEYALGSIASKPDSQGLCFVSQDQRTFREFLKEYVPPSPGNIVTTDGKVVGRHEGLWHATIGQRSGISMPQGSNETKGVWYVCGKNTETNELVIARGVDNPALYMEGATSNEFQWMISGNSFENRWKELSSSNFANLTAQYRSLQLPCQVTQLSVDDSSTQVTVKFDKPTRAIAPGQYLVLYDGDCVLGSGMIHNVMHSESCL